MAKRLYDGARVAALRELLSLNQTEMGELLGTTQSYISKIERNDEIPAAAYGAASRGYRLAYLEGVRLDAVKDIMGIVVRIRNSGDNATADLMLDSFMAWASNMARTAKQENK